MKEIEGIVCVGSNKDIDRLYGKSKGIEGQSFESFQSNGLVPFSSLQEARNARAEIEKKIGSFTRVKLAKIKMTMVENREELEILRGKQDFIVLVERDFGDVELVGADVQGNINLYPRPGAPFQANGLQPFSDLNEAVDAALEHARQTDSKATISHIFYEELQGE